MAQSVKQPKGPKKLSRGKRKAIGRSGVCSLFVRGLMTAESYFKATSQKVRKV